MAKLQLESFLPYRLNRIAAAVSQDFRSVYGTVIQDWFGVDPRAILKGSYPRLGLLSD